MKVTPEPGHKSALHRMPTARECRWQVGRRVGKSQAADGSYLGEVEVLEGGLAVLPAFISSHIQHRKRGSYDVAPARSCL